MSLCPRAVNGDGQARSNVAWHYRHGWSPVKQDYVRAYVWYVLAYQAAYSEAASYRDDLTEIMVIVAKYERRGAEKGHNGEERKCAGVAGLHVVSSKVIESHSGLNPVRHGSCVKFWSAEGGLSYAPQGQAQVAQRFIAGVG